MAFECPTKNPQLYLEGTEGNTDDLPVGEYVPPERVPSDEEDEHDENLLSLLRFSPYLCEKSEAPKDDYEMCQTKPKSDIIDMPKFDLVDDVPKAMAHFMKPIDIIPTP